MGTLASVEPATDVGAALYGLSVAAVRHMRRDLSLTSAGTLGTLARGGPSRITDLAANEGVSQPSMTMLVSRLERDGLVRRRADPSDKRSAVVAITEAGLERFRARQDAAAASVAAAYAELTGEDRAALTAALPAIGRIAELMRPRAPHGKEAAG